MDDLDSQETHLEQLKQLEDKQAAEQSAALRKEVARVAALQEELECLRSQEASQRDLKQQEAQLDQMRLQVTAQEQVLEKMRAHELDQTEPDCSLDMCDTVLKVNAAACLQCR